MKIGVIGKGGSGKSSTSWMLMQAALQGGFDVWGLDADYNQHLSRMFGVANAAIKPLADHRAALTDYAIGQRQDVTAETFDKSTLPTSASKLISLRADDLFLAPFVNTPAANLNLLRVGDFEAADKGMRCYHSRTAVADILLSHLMPFHEKQMLIVDFTAGVDPFASPIYLKLDAFVLVVEPTLKGIEVARQWQALLADTPVPLLIAANKIDSHEDTVWLTEALQPQTLSLNLQTDPALRQGERGRHIGWDDLLPDNKAALSQFIIELDDIADPHSAARRNVLLGELQLKRA